MYAVRTKVLQKGLLIMCLVGGMEVVQDETVSEPVAWEF